jgi:hypothetical protein
MEPARVAVAVALAELRHALAEKIEQWGKVTELFGEKERAYDRELAELRFSLQCARESLAEHEAAVLRLRRKVDAVQAERDSLRAQLHNRFRNAGAARAKGEGK